MSATAVSPKSAATKAKILQAALELFRRDGFENATMRDIAAAAQVATGAAYYYYSSKDAIVMDFYERSCEEMQPIIQEAVARAKGLEAALRELIRVKLDYFAPNREVLRALVRKGADPKYSLSPFSAETKHIRDIDIEWFRRVLAGSGTRLPRDLAPRLPGALWFFQMGIIFFWITDDSPSQARTATLLPLACRTVAMLIRLSALPLLRPLRKPVVELIQIAAGEQS